MTWKITKPIEANNFWVSNTTERISTLMEMWTAELQQTWLEVNSAADYVTVSGTTVHLPASDSPFVKGG